MDEKKLEEIDDLDIMIVSYIFFYGKYIGIGLYLLGVTLKMIFGSKKDKEILKKLHNQN